MATYRYKLLPVPNTTPQVYEASLKLNERPLYGSSRLGSLRTEVELRSLPSFDPTSANPVQQVDLNYELTDHLGNVCAVVTGRLLDGNGGGTPKQAELVSAQGYEPFGSLLPGRNYSSDSYRFGFQGQEKDDEMHGATGTSYAFTYRMHDARVGRFWSIDPLKAEYPWNSPYSFSENKVIQFIELEGLETGTIQIYEVSKGVAKLQNTTTHDNMGRWTGQRNFEQYNVLGDNGSMQFVFTDFDERSNQWQEGIARMKLISHGLAPMTERQKVSSVKIIKDGLSQKENFRDSDVASFKMLLSMVSFGQGVGAVRAGAGTLTYLGLLGDIDDITGGSDALPPALRDAIGLVKLGTSYKKMTGSNLPRLLGGDAEGKVQAAFDSAVDGASFIQSLGGVAGASTDESEQD
jgi:RHS repeat-associated protein